MSFLCFPSTKDVNKVKEKTLQLAEDLSKIIDKYNWEEKTNNSIFSSQFIIYFYVLEIYRQLLTVKHTKKYSEIICRTIIISIENNYQLKNKEFLNIFIKIQHQMLSSFNNNKFDSVAYILLQELGFTELELQIDCSLIKEISIFFEKIINTPIENIL